MRYTNLLFMLLTGTFAGANAQPELFVQNRSDIAQFHVLMRNIQCADGAVLAMSTMKKRDERDIANSLGGGKSPFVDEKS